jgi:hypothetical protein
MSGVFQNIDAPTPPHRPASVYPSAFGAGGGHTRWVERGLGGVNILEDARHSSVLYICQYFVLSSTEQYVQDVKLGKYTFFKIRGFWIILTLAIKSN